MSFPKRNQQKGFTIVELLVTISIFVILTGVVLFNQTKFNSSILLTNLAYNTALTIRQAQTYGINIKEFGNLGKFSPYGVHFDKVNNPKSFILFADLDLDVATGRILGNGLYDGDQTACLTNSGGNDGCVAKYNIPRGNLIKDICEEEVAKGTYACSSNKSRNSLDIVFVRPNPDAHLKFNSDSIESSAGVATIILGNPDGSTRKVVVRSNGLIEIVN